MLQFENIITTLCYRSCKKFHLTIQVLSDECLGNRVQTSIFLSLLHLRDLHLNDIFQFSPGLLLTPITLTLWKKKTD